MSLAPFDAWPDQWVDAATGVRAWFLPPRIVVVQFREPLFSLAAAMASVRAIDQVLDARRAELRAAGGLVMINDLRACRTVERNAQVAIEAAWKRLSPKDLDEAWVLKKGLPLFAVLILRMVTRFAALTTGKVQHVVEDAAEVLSRYPLSPPAPGARYPEPRELAALAPP